MQIRLSYAIVGHNCNGYGVVRDAYKGECLAFTVVGYSHGRAHYLTIVALAIVH